MSHPPFPGPDERTSAALARAEQERDLARAELTTARAELEHLRRERDDAYQIGRDSLARELAEARNTYDIVRQTGQEARP